MRRFFAVFALTAAMFLALGGRAFADEIGGVLTEKSGLCKEKAEI